MPEPHRYARFQTAHTGLVLRPSHEIDVGLGIKPIPTLASQLGRICPAMAGKLGTRTSGEMSSCCLT